MNNSKILGISCFLGLILGLGCIFCSAGEIYRREEQLGPIPSTKISVLTGKPPEIDGVLNESCWKQATVIKDFVVTKSYPPVELARNQTEVYILRDDKVLYIGAKCFDPDMKNLRPKDWFEIFIADKNLFVYYQFWIHPSGETDQWGSPGVFLEGALWHGKVSMHKDHWQVEMAIPVFNLSPDLMDGDMWRFNVCRQRLSPPHENSQWSNTGGFFHVPDRFGKLFGMSGFDYTPPVDLAKKIKEKMILGYTIPDYMILDRSYYTTEEEAKLKIYLTKDTLEKIKGKLLLQIEVKDKEGNQVLKEKEHRLPHNTLFSSFKIKDFPVGDYSVSAKLESEDQEVVVFSQTLKKLPPHHNEVKVNRFTRMLLVNDEPFIPLISSAQFWGKRLAGHGVPDNSLEIVAKESGFNTLAIWPFTCKTQIEECHRHGLKVILFPLVTWQKTGKELTEALKGVFKEYKDSPNLLAWIIADEGNIGGTEEEFKERYKILKEIDPYRPIFRNDIWTVGHGGPGGLETTDIFCGGYGDWRLVDAINIDAVPRGVPTLSLADWMDYGAGRPIGYPTPSETICWIYQVLIHGACGGFWWGTHHARPFVPALWEAMRQIRKEMDFLAPVFNTLDPGIKITCDNPAIHFTVRKYQGKYYLICVNVKSTREKAEFKLDPAVFSKKGEAIVLFEGKKKEWKNGKIIDFFNPLERRVYQIRGE